MPSYHIRTCIPIVHSMTGREEDKHTHSVELALYLSRPGGGMLRFRQVEEAVDRCLAPYRNRFLNAMPEFHDGAAIEQVGEVFFLRLRETMAAAGLVLERFEIGETPLRTYIIRQEDDHSTEKDGIL